MTVIYLNPECHDVMAEDGLFHVEKETRAADHAVYIYSN